MVIVLQVKYWFLLIEVYLLKNAVSWKELILKIYTIQLGREICIKKVSERLLRRRKFIFISFSFVFQSLRLLINPAVNINIYIILCEKFAAFFIVHILCIACGWKKIIYNEFLQNFQMLGLKQILLPIQERDRICLIKKVSFSNKATLNFEC